MKRRVRLLLPVLLALAGCEADPPPAPAPGTPDSTFLDSADVRRIVAQGVAEAGLRGRAATLAVTDRMGNVLAVYRMAGAAATVDVQSGLGIDAGLDGIRNTIPDTAAAISKAITGAYLSSSGNAFSTRTASQIIQRNFNPGEAGQPSGPLFGVQFSQLPCSDLVRRLASDGDTGPKHSPLGLAGDPGGLPLYKNGVVVGGIGVVADGVYGVDLDIGDLDSDLDELIAVAAGSGYAAPADIRANRITADGRTLRYVDSEALLSTPALADPATLAPARFVPVTGYTAGGVRAGARVGTPASGLMPHDTLGALSAWMLTDSSGGNRYPAQDSVQPAVAADGMQRAEVTQLLKSALGIANRARAQIRRPLGSAAQVTVVVVDSGGNVLGLARTPDAPLFGADVALQKARSAGFFSKANAAAQLTALPDAAYVSGASSSLAAYVAEARTFFGAPTLFADGTAFSARALGNVHRPTFPDGPTGTPAGPLSKPLAQWSPFNVGLQLDLVYNQLVQSVVANNFAVGCTGLPELANGMQIFPGGVPIYRGNQLIGAIGVSGDGVDQDDMIAFLGLARANAALAAAGNADPLANAPAALRADRLAPQGLRLRYAQCPQAPFNDSSEQNVCAGL
jgi:uncharacterized protein GlcG (DUF336 family)